MPLTRSKSSSNLNKCDTNTTATTTTTTHQEEEPELTGWNAFQKLNKGMKKSDITANWNSMLPEERLKYGKKKPIVKVLVRCRTKYFVETLERLGHERRKWLEDTPFHQLLAMSRHIQDNVMIKKLSTSFNTQNNSLEFEGETRVLTANDFTQIMGIEDGDEDIKLPRTVQDKPQEGQIKPRKGQDKSRKGQNKNLPTLLELQRDFVKEGQLHICMDKVVEELTRGANEDNVKRAYILFALRYIICAPTEDLRLSWLDIVRDVRRLSKKRWATFAIHSLVKGIRTYQNSKANEEIGIGGCTIFLQLFATKGSITVPKGNPPLESRSRGKRKRPKKTRDTDCTLVEAKELYYQAHKSCMDFIEKERKRFFTMLKKNSTKQELMEDWFSDQMNGFVARSTNLDTNIDERVVGVGEH